MSQRAAVNRITAEDLTGVHDHNPELERKRASLREMHNDDFRLAAQDLFYFGKFVQTEDDDQKRLRPFAEYNYLKRINRIAETEKRLVVLKSRRLLISWWGMLRQLHQAMFAGTGLPGSHDVYRGGVMTIGETEAKYLMQRIHRVYKRLPDWLRARAVMVKDNDMYIEFQRGGTIQAFPLKREGPQTFGFSEVFFDEMALQEAVRTVWTGLIPTLGADGTLIAVSTPNGKSNLFYDIWINKNGQYKIERVRLHWTENPEHDQDWYDVTTGPMDEQMIARMFELSFAAYFGDRVWPVFDRKTHLLLEEPEIITGKPCWLGWDFGYHYPATSLWQRNSRDQWIGFREFLDFDVSMDVYCKDVKEKLEAVVDRHKTPIIMAVPPDGLQVYRTRSITGATNDIMEIKQSFKVGHKAPQIRFGLQEAGSRDNEAPRMKETRKTFNLRGDDQTGILIWEDGMPTFVEGCGGGYAYPETGGEQPMNNEYAHVQDSYQAVVTAFNRYVIGHGKSQQPQRKRTRIGSGTGL